MVPKQLLHLVVCIFLQVQVTDLLARWWLVGGGGEWNTVSPACVIGEARRGLLMTLGSDCTWASH